MNIISFQKSRIVRRSRASALILTLAGFACTPLTAIVSIDETPASLAISLAPSTPMDVASSPEQLDLAVGDSASLSVIGLNALGNPVGTAAVTWTSAEPAIASVDADGAVAAVGVGSTELTASVGGIDAVIEVVVVEAVEPEVQG